MIYKASIVDEYMLGVAPIEIINLSSKGVDKGWFQKRASILVETASTLKPRKGKTAMYMIPMGAYEFYAANRNADGWPERKCTKVAHNGTLIDISSGLIERHPTFVSDAHIYKEHKNKDPKLASGEIALSEYNPVMHRVEIISFVDNDKWDSEIQKVASGNNQEISMAANVSGDYCSFCGNYATEPTEYCQHIKFYKNAILDDGHLVNMVNNAPTFIDCSGVGINADRNGYAVGIIDLGSDTKTASMNRFEKEAKMAILSKLNDIEKSLSCPAVSIDLDNKVRAVDPNVFKPLDGHSITIIRSVGPSEVASDLSSKGGLLSPDDFIETLFGDMGGIGSIISKVKDFLPSVFGKMFNSPECLMEPPVIDTGMGVSNKKIESIVDAIQPLLSILPDDAEIRVQISSTETSSPDIEIEGKKVVQKCSSEVEPEIEKLAMEYGRYVVDSIWNMERCGLAPDYYLPVVRARL